MKEEKKFFFERNEAYFFHKKKPFSWKLFFLIYLHLYCRIRWAREFRAYIKNNVSRRIDVHPWFSYLEIRASKARWPCRASEIARRQPFDSDLRNVSEGGGEEGEESVSFELHLARPMSKAHFRSIHALLRSPLALVAMCGEIGVEDDPFGISDPAGMRTPVSLADADSHNTSVFRCPFFPLICPLLRTRLSRFQKKICTSARAKITVKCMCMRNYVVTTPGALTRV